MPSTPIGSSGSWQMVSGNPYSGLNPVPVGGFQIRWATNASGQVFIGFSGNVTGGSGGFTDGMYLNPGDPMFVPKLIFNQSGSYPVWAIVASGVQSGTLLSWQPF